MSRFDEPTEEVLHLLHLTSRQYRIGLDLAATPEGLSRAVIETYHHPTAEELAELIERGFVTEHDSHYHATHMGSGLLKAIAEFVRATAS